MEEYYNAALTEVEKDSWGPNLKMRATPNTKKTIRLLIKEERKRLMTIKQIVDLIDTNDAEIEELYDKSRLIHNRSWGTLTWGPPPPWAVTEQQPLPIAAPNPPPANEANGFQD